MLLTITTTHVPATDLGYLLHKHPRKCQTFFMRKVHECVFGVLALESEPVDSRL